MRRHSVNRASIAQKSRLRWGVLLPVSALLAPSPFSWLARTSLRRMSIGASRLQARRLRIETRRTNGGAELTCTCLPR